MGHIKHFLSLLHTCTFYIICMILKLSFSLYSDIAAVPISYTTVSFKHVIFLFYFFTNGFFCQQGKQNPPEQKEEATGISQSCHLLLEEVQLFSTSEMSNFLLLV